MSGLDEQYSDECPICHTIPRYWTLGNKITGGLVWLYTKNYGTPRKTNSIAFTVFDKIKRVSEVESQINYMWCSNCLHQFEDIILIEDKIRRVKILEEKGRVNLS